MVAADGSSRNGNKAFVAEIDWMCNCQFPRISNARVYYKAKICIT